jgi:Na+/proline symporter
MYRLTPQDWCWIGGFLAVALAMAVYHSRRSLKSIDEYFVAGQRIPWWILGTSIVATSFAADTPLVIAGLVIKKGISGNWFWWAIVPSGMLGVFVFAALWRRSGCVTQAEFTVFRYGPARGKLLRVMYVFYFGILRNCVVLAWVNLAMLKIIGACSGLDMSKGWAAWVALAACFVLTVTYTMLGGITGVMWTDFVQFILALACSTMLAWYGIQHVGGLGELVAGLDGQMARNGVDVMAFLPAWDSSAIWAVAVYLSIFWVACTPTDCNGYAVQRLLSARSERHAVWGYLWFNVAHYVLRTWPWILVGLVALVVFDYGSPNSQQDPEGAYMRVLLEMAPAWLIGPVLASLLAAYMSTIDTHVNWGASLVINDLYKPYVAPHRSDRHYVFASHGATIGVAFIGVLATLATYSIEDAWGLFFALTSGMGVVGVLRWLWWRVTAWSEIGCMTGALSGTLYTKFATDLTAPFDLLIVVPVALLGAIIATYAFPPEPTEVLDRFVAKVRPPGPGWNIRRHLDSAPTEARDGATAGSAKPAADPTLRRSVYCWLLATIAVYGAMFGIGVLLLRDAASGIALIIGSAIAGYLAGMLHRPTGLAERPPD